jgi:hypothetical protein
MSDERGARLTLRTSLHLLHGCGDLKAITGLFQGKSLNPLQADIQEKSLILLDLPICS